jgi:gamma-glutamylcyclotransferase
MNPQRMITRKAFFTERVGAKLHDYKLVFNFRKSGNPCESAANVIPDSGSCVEGALYLTDEDAISKLDVFEGCPDHYRREEVTVVTNDGREIDALVYIANDDKTADGLKPSREYLGHLLAGQDLLSEDYFLKLKNTETLD